MLAGRRPKSSSSFRDLISLKKLDRIALPLYVLPRRVHAYLELALVCGGFAGVGVSSPPVPALTVELVALGVRVAVQRERSVNIKLKIKKTDFEN